MEMKKREETKEDGRYIIFYDFEDIDSKLKKDKVIKNTTNEVKEGSE